MYTGTKKSELIVNLSNIPGWQSKRKIVIIESDDWGSIRMSSNEAYNQLLKSGMPVDKSHYNKFDCLECNSDLEMLMYTLQKFTDKNGRNPVVTGVNIVANPNFEKIKANDYSKYEYESFSKTLEHYSEHNKVIELWKKGIANHLLFPTFHGREHLNVNRWMKALNSDNQSTLLGFNHGVTGIPEKGINNEKVADFQAAFDIDSASELKYLSEILKTGLELFEESFGFKSQYFVPTNGPFNNSLESDLEKLGVKFINSAKRQVEPLGNGVSKINYRYLGKENTHKQVYITRNCFFEPASSGYEWPRNTDWVNNCLKEIEIAFRWNKPAVISTHRVNYSGYLHPDNRESGLLQLSLLLKQMLKKWPDIEFMTTVELGNLILDSKK